VNAAEPLAPHSLFAGPGGGEGGRGRVRGVLALVEKQARRLLPMAAWR
jgi:hypothetical protein